MACVIALFYSTVLPAQTPIANRVKVAAKHLPKKASIVAKYTDNDRHCLYYLLENKLYCRDVVLNINEEIDFAPHRFEQILSASLSPDSRYVIICIDKGNKRRKTSEERYELWRLDSKTKAVKRIASGFAIERKGNGHTFKKP